MHLWDTMTLARNLFLGFSVLIPIPCQLHSPTCSPLQGSASGGQHLIQKMALASDDVYTLIQTFLFLTHFFKAAIIKTFVLTMIPMSNFLQLIIWIFCPATILFCFTPSALMALFPATTGSCFNGERTLKPQTGNISY